ncbi:protein mono-ADP-ribosyltransferase PARP14-like [Chanos chanos]|uniref:Protein mono-ADP-ribosyltransferase PARP14-like n=1 Tax=Chanos chanos TaxID=29144 RepID=A0A6J2WXG8_CHACN|nr:protein mono-ADP-ribosyltransferase PARP14-like [Chanos chanos]
MEDDLYPVIVEGDWSPELSKVVKNKLQIYFQSKKKSQGGDCVIQYDDQTGIATVCFKSSEVRNSVLSKVDHVLAIDKKELKLRLRKPNETDGAPENASSQPVIDCDEVPGTTHPVAGPDEKLEDSRQTSAVIVENIPENVSKDMLGLMVEKICDVAEKEFSLELICELSAAVLTFNNPHNLIKFLLQSRDNSRFQQHGLTARALEKTCCVRVENLPPQANEDLLELYFDKCGVKVKSVDLIPDEQAALVALQKPEEAERILKENHTICKVPVNIYPYCESLGTALYGSNRPEWKLPEPFTVKIHPAIQKYLSAKGLISTINANMGKHLCKVNMDGAEVQLSPLPGLLKLKDETSKYIKGWRQSASDAFKNIMCNFDFYDCPIHPTVWAAVEKEIGQEVKDQAYFSMDTTQGIFTVAGLTKNILQLRKFVDECVQRVMRQMERDKSSTSEAMEMSAAMFSMLEQEGLKKCAAALSPQLCLTYRKDINRLVISGVPNEILVVKNWILEKKLGVRQKPMQCHPSLSEFLRSVDSDELSRDLFTSHGTAAVYKVEDEKIFLMGFSDKTLSDAEKRLKTMLSFHVINVEDKAVLEKPEWKALSCQLQDLYNSPKKRAVLLKFSTEERNRLIICGFTQPVIEVSQNLECFVNKHTRVEEVIRVKTYAVMAFIKENKSQDWKKFLKSLKVHFDSKQPRIRLRGERVHVEPARNSFENIAASLFTNELTITKAGARKYFQEQGSLLISMAKREYGCIVVLQEDYMLDEEEEEVENRTENFGQVSCEVNTPGGVRITVRRADICQFKADAVVNAANEDLKHIGGVAGALLQAAGPSLQQCCDHYTTVNGRLQPGDAITTEAGQLPCKHVIHTVGPRFSDTDKKTAIMRLKKAVRESLRQAVIANCSSIAIPAISSGIFGFPLELCTETIATALREYIEEQSYASMTSLTEIHLVDNNSNTVNAITQAIKKVFADWDLKMTIPKQAGHRGRGSRGRGHRGHNYRGRAHRGSGHRGFGHRGSGPHRNSPRDDEQQRFENEGGNQMKNQTSDTKPGGRSQEFQRSGILETKRTSEGLRIVLRKGNIQDALSDVIVNTISEDLDLKKGAVSKALLETAGPQLQTAANTKAGAARLSYGDVVVTDGYKLRCERVFHTVCPPWDNGSGPAEDILVQIIRWCLKEAEQQRMSSISFPALGTGNLGFAKDLVSRLFLEEIQSFSRKSSPQTLQEVVIIVHPSDTETVECFIKSFRGEAQDSSAKRHRPQHTSSSGGQSSKSHGIFGAVSTPTLGVHSVKVGHLTLEVSSGDITKEACDVIVNSSNNTFSLKTGVSKAILDAAGSSVEQECSQIVNGSNSQQDSGMILTSAGRLPCRHIIHIVGRNDPKAIKNIVYSVLKFSEDQKFNSVSFPALGTGQGGANPSAVADAMIDAVVDFAKRKGHNVKHVKFLIFQTSMVSDFHQSMLKREKEGVGEQKGFLTKLKGYKVAGLLGSPVASSSPEESFVMAGEEFAPVVFQLCGESPQRVSQAKEMIRSLILKEQLETKIEEDTIAHFTQEETDKLKALQKELTVSIKMEKKGRNSFIFVEGLTRDVFSADQRIRDMIRKVEKKELRCREAFLLSSVVEWQYKDQSGNFVGFDIHTNYDLEEAFGQKQSRVQIKINTVDYEADLSRKKAMRGKREIELKRIDLTDNKASVALPSDWEDMKGAQVIPVTLKPNSQEYNDVEKKFKSTGLSATVIKIERIQNSLLWRSYVLKKKHMDEKNQHSRNEKQLFHGTSASGIDQINNHGFNRSYAGTNGAVYGNGSYFAVDPVYSARGYAKPDTQGHKRMYLARVLVGDYTQGAKDLLVPPAKNSGNAADLYDSVTDDPNNPTMFVIFNDTQAYPEYLITFQ